MKYLLLIAISLDARLSVQTNQPGVARSILSSQRSTIERRVGYPVRSDYELTRLMTKKCISNILHRVDSAMQADGVSNPLQDSLHFVAAYYVAGFMKGAAWRDTSTYYEWGTAIGKGIVRKKWKQLDREWSQVANAAFTWNDHFFEQYNSDDYEGHGYNILYTRWYARNQPHKTHTIAFFLSPN